METENRFYFSVDPISLEEKEKWNSEHTLLEIKEHNDAVRDESIKMVPPPERHKWFIVDQMGVQGSAFYRVYISFRIAECITPKGRRRRFSRVLRMIEVPFTRYKYVDGIPTPAEDGMAEAVDIEKLKSIP